MAKIIIRKKGQITAEVPLDESKPVVGGRSANVDIVLDAEKGISREHFKIFYEEGQWKLECLSKLGNLYYGGEPVSITTLEPGTTFSVEPFEFEFLSNSTQPEPAVEDIAAATSEDSFSDRTIVHKVSLAAYIKIMNQDGDLQQKIKLEGGDTWVAGRDVSAQIMISDDRVSRKQFEIRKTSLGYEIVDLGSVNGTYINEKLLESNDSITLKSGDVIRVLDHTLIFEIHDPHFFDRVENLPVVPFEEPPVEEIFQAPAQITYQQGPISMDAMLPPPPTVDPKVEKTKKIRMILLAVIVLGALVFLLDDGSKSESSNQLSNQAPLGPDPLAGLTPQQKSEYKQSLELAKRYYMEGNYSLSLSEAEELAKTYKVNDPDLEKLKNTALAAIETQKQLLKQEKEEKERQVMEAKIAVAVQNCSKMLNKFKREEDLDNCLIEALQLNPAHNSILALKSQFQAILADKEARRQKQAEYDRRVAMLRGIYEAAKKSESDKEYLEVIEAYNKVIDSSLPDPNGYKERSRKRLARLRVEMDKKIKTFENQAEKFRQKQDYKQAVLTLRAALKIDPTRQDLKTRADDLKNELRKLMMVLYQEGVLEESFGNVEGGDNRAGAKEKWRKIIEQDLTDGEYYQKAYIKLKKYGAQ